MTLHPDWKSILTRAWSVRLIAAFVILSGIEGAFRFLTTEAAPLWMHIVTPVLGALALLARLLTQKNLTSYIIDESGAVPKRGLVAAGTVAAVMAAAVPMVQKWEGLRTEAYRDVVGVWTVCYGETMDVQPGDSYTAAECAAMLEPRLVQDYYLPVVACAPQLADAPIPVQAAITSWTYNVGVGAACGSTLARYLRAGDWRAACEQLPRWNRAGGKVWQGLVNRRADERGLCLSGL